VTNDLVQAYGAFLLDLDGTVYRGQAGIPGATEAVSLVRDRGRTVRFITNNASRGPDEVAGHLTELGFATDRSEVYTSAQAAAKVLAERLTEGAHVLVVGSAALVDEVKAVGLHPVREHGDQVAAVVQGLSKDTGWRELAEACMAIRAGVRWVACNVDPTLPTEHGELPGNGALVAALRIATGAEPFVAGKPGKPLLEEAVASVDGQTVLVVGDRLDTDIAGAHATGLDSLLVLTGVSTAADVLAAPAEQRPTYLAAELGEITEPADSLRIAPQPGWSVEVDGEHLRVAAADGRAGTPTSLLRALCAARFDAGATFTPRAEDDRARDALAELGLS
jgi:HAD superfamily hydrolase (TIGR01457 family)